MWILQLLPDSLILWFTNILLAIGIAATVLGFFIHKIPLFYQYQLPLRVLGVVLLAAGVYLRGGYGVEMAWRERVAEVEKKVAEAEAKSAQANVEIQTRVVEKTRVVKEKGEEIVKYIDREVVKNNEVIKYVENCPVPKAVIDAHNAAAILNQAAQGERR